VIEDLFLGFRVLALRLRKRSNQESESPFRTRALRKTLI